MKSIIITLVFISVSIASCNDSTDSQGPVQNNTVAKQIEAGGKTFVITDSLIGSHMLFEIYTMSEYFGLKEDSVYYTSLVVDSSGKMDELLIYPIAKSEIDTNESYVTGTSFNDKNARMIKLVPKAGQLLNGMHYKEDGSDHTIASGYVEISFDDAEKADRVAASLGIKN